MRFFHRVEMLDMELLPKGANFVRVKTLWEIGLHLAGNPTTPYGGNRDMVITIGSGSGAAFRPWLRLATGSAILAEEVAKGGGASASPVHKRYGSCAVRGYITESGTSSDYAVSEFLRAVGGQALERPSIPQQLVDRDR